MIDAERTNYKPMLIQAHQVAESTSEGVRIASDMLHKLAEIKTSPMRCDVENCLGILQYHREADKAEDFNEMSNMEHVKSLLNEVDWPRIVRIVEMWNPANDDLFPFKERQLDALNRLTETISK